MRAICKFRFVIIISLITATAATSRAQTVLPDLTGQPLTTKQYENVEGTPFLMDNWVNGTVKLSNGNTYKDVPLKYNEVDDVVYFKNKNGEELMFADPVQEFILTVLKNAKLQPRHFRNGYADGGKPKAFYEVLAEGSVQLLKKNIKYIQEDKEYNSATSTKKFVEDVKYYLFVSGKLTPIKKDKKSIFAALGNKQPELENYIKTNNLNVKEEEDLGKVIAFYNTL